ncbi:hypothetical protein GGP41_001653 [Bipolaris sorokiniana]|uniref:Uncharacterized protein n=1 Tax=Cochliobolus sativus TaxID=45130 RepID=A0A8H5ZQB1_COCSA|nr:hypothetical protein GGP41_001653 [Bipolaris sorokiniana]
MPLVVLYICAFECCSPRRCDFLIKDVGTSIHPPALASECASQQRDCVQSVWASSALVSGKHSIDATAC